MQPSKRSFRPVNSVPTTAEKYGEQFGIPDDIQAALQNVGRKGRMTVTQGRPFDRTQTLPSFPTSSPLIGSHDDFDIPGTSASYGSSTWTDTSVPSTSAFVTSADAMEAAQQAIEKENRRRELLPYAATVDSLNLSPRIKQGSSPERNRKELGFDGNLDWGGAGKSDLRSSPTRKRGVEEEENAGDGGSDTEIEDDEDDDPMAKNQSHSSAFGARSAGLTTASMSSINDFPSVFRSSKISQPELFTTPGEAPENHANRALNATRRVKGMPRMALGKTMSAPVGKLGGFGGFGHAGGMDVDESMEDGFDVSEWAASEKF